MSLENGARCLALVVDDDPDSLRMVSDALEANGVTALVARSGEDALLLAERVTPDIVLLDAVMPNLDGFETCLRLKAPPLSIEAPVLFMTGLSEPESILRGLSVGGIDYVTKPLILEELLARVTVHVLNARMIQSARRALDGMGRMVVGMTDTGRISWWSPRAREASSEIDALLHGPDGALRPNIRDWVDSLRNRPLSTAEKLPMPPFVLTYIGLGASGELLISLARPEGLRGAPLLAQSFGLTEREAEVLEWLAQGKTNSDIGDILNLSPRTVNKHLEQVFQKMGVDNRTSAAVMADRRLGML